jgi:hypothetical protein
MLTLTRIKSVALPFIAGERCAVGAERIERRPRIPDPPTKMEHLIPQR